MNGLHPHRSGALDILLGIIVEDHPVQSTLDYVASLWHPHPSL
jgi:hypothetical protein